jgi:hypothetical protein
MRACSDVGIFQVEIGAAMPAAHGDAGPMPSR